jgi:coenzyme F420-0:L-glutamate ligase/coenzyme F420-1:gamma-L-glutamate ligase
VNLLVSPITGLGEIRAGDDLAALLVAALITPAPGDAEPPSLMTGDVLVVAHKAVSKAEGRVIRLSDVSPSQRAVELAASLEKDPRQVQVVLDESRQVIRAAHGVLIVETHHGFICANAGVDASNVEGEDSVLLLPVDPDASARRLRARVRELTGVSPGVVITDSFGRAWRTGQCDVTVGCAGISPLEDWRGGQDAYGRELRATIIAVADQLAATADLARRKDGGQPVVLVRGASRHVLGPDDDGPGVAPLIRDAEHDLFR